MTFINKFFLKRCGMTLITGMASALLLSVQPATADVFGVVLDAGFSKDNPTDTTSSPFDISSKFGASLAGSNITFNTDTGVLRADIVNSGAGIMTGFGLSLSEAFVGRGLESFSVSCAGCAFDNTSPLNGPGPGNGVAGSFDSAGTFDVGVVRSTGPGDPGNVNDGINSGDSASFIWDFAGTFEDITGFFGDGGLTSVVELLEVPGTGALTPDGSDKSTFWVAHIQELGSDEDSDRIGGSSSTTVSEPGALALFGVGLIGLTVLRRRSQLSVARKTA